MPSNAQMVRHMDTVAAVKRFARAYPNATAVTVLQEMRARGFDPQGLPGEDPRDAVARWMKEGVR